MSRRWRTLGVVAFVLITVSAGQAQAPAPPLSCEDRLSASAIQLHATTVSQLRERGESATEIAALRKRVGQLEAEVAKLRPKEKPAPKEDKK